jgi:hypothetical protein
MLLFMHLLCNFICTCNEFLIFKIEEVGVGARTNIGHLIPHRRAWSGLVWPGWAWRLGEERSRAGQDSFLSLIYIPSREMYTSFINGCGAKAKVRGRSCEISIRTTWCYGGCYPIVNGGRHSYDSAGYTPFNHALQAK